MATQAQRIDAIEAAILSLSQSVSSIANMLATQNAAPKSTTPRTTKNTQPQAATETAPRFPKAPMGTITGTVVRHAGGPRAGYGMLVKTPTNGDVWINCVKAGGRPALFATIPVGATVEYAVNEAGYVVTDSTSPIIPPVGQQRTLPANTPKRRKAASQTTQHTTTVAALMTAPAPVMAPPAPTQKPVKLGETGKGCRMCGGNHGNEGTQKRELECLERIYFQQTGKTAGGIFDAAFTVWTRDFATVRSQTATAPHAAAAVAPVASVPVAPMASPVAGSESLNSPVAQSASAPSQPSTVIPTITDGEHVVTLVGFPKTKTGMIKVHNATIFSGKDGNGRWLTQMSPELYTKATHFTANDRLKVTVKGGIPTSIKRVSKIESDTGTAAGVKSSGKQEPPVQVTTVTKDDTRTEATRAAKKAARRAKLANA